MDKNSEKLMGSVEEQLGFIESADSIKQINELMTSLISAHKEQALVKGDNLEKVRDSILGLIEAEESDDDKVIFAIAEIGRLAAISRGRDDVALDGLSDVLNESPIDVDNLSNDREKVHAAQAIVKLDVDWLQDYCVFSVSYIHSAESARRVIVSSIVERAGNLSDAWQVGLGSFAQLKQWNDEPETWAKACKKICSAWLECIHGWRGEVGQDPGAALALFLEEALKTSKIAKDDEATFDIIDGVLGQLLRIIELRFSHALEAQTYEPLVIARRVLGKSKWEDFSSHSKSLDSIKSCLREMALVLARQNRTDKSVMELLVTTYLSTAQLEPAMRLHFEGADDLDPDVKNWWIKAGKGKERSRTVEHRVGNSEDQNIGTLLLEIEYSKSAMEKLERAVVPYLEIIEPPLSATVRKAAASYKDLARITRQLARMRRLSHTNLLNEVIEYNKLEHEMLGGHKMGVRKVRVLRDGITKDFGGKIKTLVKPRVEPADEKNGS